MSHRKPIRAAGAVVLRTRTDDTREVLVVHRPRYRDITLPKGKQHRNEPLPLTAVREVAEETGCRIRLGVPLQPVEYSIRKVGPKVVSWWIGEALEEQGHSPDDEVDEVLWLPVDRADDLLTYPSELQVLEEALSVPLPTTTIVVVRHGKAVSRKEWAAGTSRKHRDDARRPLDRRGKRQAEALPQILDCYAVHRLVSSSAARCVQTLTPYAKQIGVDVRADDELTEEVHAEAPDRTEDQMRRIVADALNDPAHPVAICGHRPVLPLMNHALEVVYHPMSTAECLIVHLDRDGKSLAEERLDSII